MTDRVRRMLQSLKVSKYPLCIEYFKLANESLDRTAGEPMLLRRAKLHPRRAQGAATSWRTPPSPRTGAGTKQAPPLSSAVP